MRVELDTEYYEERSNGAYSAHFGGNPSCVRGVQNESTLEIASLINSRPRRSFVPRSLDEAVFFLNASLLQYMESPQADTVLGRFIDKYKKRHDLYDRNPEKLELLVRSIIKRYRTEEINTKKLSR